MSEVSKNSFIGSAFWKIMESFSSKGISMIVSLILARLLAPDQFGIVSVTAIFIGFTDILLQGGFSTALIQKKEVTQEDYSTVFAISIISASFLYGVLFLASPAIARYFGKPIITNVMRIIGLTVFCQALGAVRNAVIVREMKFRLLFVCTSISNIISGVLGVGLALLGAGVWALVVQQLSQQFLLTVILFSCVKIRVHMTFSEQSFRAILPFSMKVLASSMMSFVADSAFSVAVGKRYSLEDLGYYNKGGQFPRQFSLYTFGAISSVLLTTLARHADDKQRLKQLVRKIHITSNYIIFPMMVGLCCVADPFVRVVLTERWLPCVGVLQWTCLYYAATPIMLTNVQLHLALGDGGMRIRQETIRIVLMILTLVVFLLIDANIVALSCVQAVIAVLVAAISCVETQRSIGYAVWRQLRDNASTLICVGVMSASTLWVGQFISGAVFKLAGQIAVGVVTYVLMSVITRNEGFRNVWDIVKSRKKT